jgi:hypothetical protein
MTERQTGARFLTTAASGTSSSLGVFWDEFIEMFSCSSNIEMCQWSRDLRIHHDHHHVGVACEKINEAGELRISDFHSLELSLSLWTTQFKLLNNIGNSFMAMTVIGVGAVEDEREGRWEGGGESESNLSLEVWEMTRNVAFSNRTISSAPQISANSPSWVSNCWTFGIKEYTICDQAR